MANPIGTYTASDTGVLVTTANNFFQLRNVSTKRIEIIEMRVFQTSITALAMDAIQIDRGSGAGTGGTGVAEDEEDAGGLTAGASAFKGPTFTAEVTTLDLTKFIGWNVLQEMVWLPTPEFPLVLAGSDNMGLSLLTAATYTIGYSVTWQEYGV